MKDRIKILILLAFVGFSLNTRGQVYELSKNGTSIRVKGSSNLHDWTMELKSFSSGINIHQDGTTGNLDKVTFTCRTSDLRSESSLMDKKAHEALKSNTFPEIRFESISGTNLAFSEGKFTGNLEGRLNIAGKTKTVDIPFSGSANPNNTITITAETNLLMSSFDIAPPTAMLGTLKTGDKISVSLSLQYVMTGTADLSK